jgi:ABC-type phosphate transport system ATPase subunit/preprotein translocase subunit SecE
VLSGTIQVPRAPPVHERYDHKATKDNWIIPSSIAFVGQIPWIENATMKDNILFGLPYDPIRYQKVIKACALEKDLEMLIDGEVTEIGANGINLSGGQRWRMSFARALYSRAGILILDDIFSAVDAHVGKHIFEEGLTGELAERRTRILVTHHVSLCLPRTEYAILLGDGTVEHAGAVVDLQRSGSLAEIFSHERDSAIDKPDGHSPESGILSGLGDDNYERPKHVDAVINGNSTPGTSEREAEDKKTTTPRKFVEEEKRETGKIKWEIYREYLKSSGSIWFWVIAMMAFVGYQALLVGRVGPSDSIGTSLPALTASSRGGSKSGLAPARLKQ